MTYLLQRNGTYYFRVRIPASLASITSRREVCLSLKTRDKREALLRCGRYIEAFHTSMTKGTFDLSLFITTKDGTQSRSEFDANKPEEVALYKQLVGLQQQTASKPALQVSDLVTNYLAHLTTENKPAAHASCKRTFELWQASVGEISLDEFTQGKLGEFKRHLETLTARGKTAPLSAKTVASHVKNVVAFSYWAQGNYDGITALSSRGVAPKRLVKQHEQRQAFSAEELAVLFGSAFDSLRSEQQWLMRLGALTGARIEEICQLSLVEDVRVTESGTHYISINEDDAEKGVKTTSGIREVPIHPRLLDLGFLIFVEQQKASGCVRPFESLWSAWRGKWGKYPGKWFSSYKAAVLTGVNRPGN